MKYATIVADPPWPMPIGGMRNGRGEGRLGRGRWAEVPRINALPYPTMSLAEIASLPVLDLAEQEAHLYLWTVNRYVRDTYDIAEAWGFRPAQLLTWCKRPMGEGLGGAFVSTTEHILFCRRGVLKESARIDSTWWLWKRGEHSAKPEAFMDMVEQVSPGPYLEMFSRRARLGWATWGNEALEGEELMLGRGAA